MVVSGQLHTLAALSLGK